MRKITLFTLFLGAAALVFAAGAYAQTSEFVDADGDGISDNVAQMHMHHPFGMGPGHELRGLMANLTAEQRAEVEALVQSLKDEGKTPQEIHTALGEKLQSFGITLPEDWNLTPEQRFLKQFNLTDEQLTEVKALVQSLKDEGKTPQEIHTALGEKLQSFGITLPENWDRPRMPGRGMGWRGRGGGQPPASK